MELLPLTTPLQPIKAAHHLSSFFLHCLGASPYKFQHLETEYMWKGFQESQGNHSCKSCGAYRKTVLEAPNLPWQERMQEPRQCQPRPQVASRSSEAGRLAEVQDIEELLHSTELAEGLDVWAPGATGWNQAWHISGTAVQGLIIYTAGKNEPVIPVHAWQGRASPVRAAGQLCRIQLPL